MDKYQETFKTWNKIAQIYEDKFMDLNLYDNTYTVFCKLLPKNNASILEVGCGPGNITRYLLNKNPELNIKGLDISPNMIKLAQRNNPTAQLAVMDCREIHKIKTKFDAIVSGFSIPYISPNDCTKFIADCGDLLYNSGVLYISFVAGHDKDSGYQTGSSGDLVYFYYHDLQKIKKDLKTNSFEIIELINLKYHKSNRDEEIHTVIIAKKVN